MTWTPERQAAAKGWGRGATEAPWELEYDDAGDEMGMSKPWPYRVNAGEAVILDFTGGEIPSDEDAAFIVNARNDEADKLAEIDRAWAEIERLHEENGLFRRSLSAIVKESGDAPDERPAELLGQVCTVISRAVRTGSTKPPWADTAEVERLREQCETLQHNLKMMIEHAGPTPLVVSAWDALPHEERLNMIGAFEHEAAMCLNDIEEPRDEHHLAASHRFRRGWKAVLATLQRRDTVTSKDKSQEEYEAELAACPENEQAARQEVEIARQASEPAFDRLANAVGELCVSPSRRSVVQEVVDAFNAFTTARDATSDAFHGAEMAVTTGDEP